MTLAELVAELERQRAEAATRAYLAPVARVLDEVLAAVRRVDEMPTAARLVSTREAGQFLGLAPKTVARWCAAGRFPGAVKTNGRRGDWRIPLAVVYQVAGRARSAAPTEVRLWRAP